ncbi:MAG: prolipoprotein diacylglyceryl transferase family protein, partial [Anaerolineales bacterium]
AINNVIFVALGAGLAGARLAYAGQYQSAYLANPIGLLALTPATLSPGAGFVIGLAAAVWYGRRHHLLLRPTLDALAPGLATFLIAVGVAHLFSGDAFGASAKLPWSIYLWNDYRHPSQVYEIIAALAILILTWRRSTGRPDDGSRFLLVIALSSCARVFLEAFRGDSVIWLGGFRAAQIVGLVVLAASLWLLKDWAQASSPAPANTQEILMAEVRR